MGKGDDRRREDELKRQAAAERARADAAIQTASQPDEFETRRRQRVLDLDKWESGESGPIDVRNMPGAGVNIGLFNEAKQSRDAGRKGRGYGLLGDGANPNFAASLDKEFQMERDLMASGMLEENVEDTLAGKDAELYGLTGIANQRRMNIAGLREGRYRGDQGNYMQYLTRPRQPSFFRQLALAAISGGSQIAAAHAGGGAGGGG